MKKILISIILFCSVIVVYSQNNCSGVQNTAPESTISVFDWTAPVYSGVYIEVDNVTQEIFPRSPFYFGDSDENINHLSTAIVKDFLESDGWVLLHTNFETIVESDPNNQTRGVSVPSFALYNRYESLVRTFFYITSSLDVDEGYNKARVTMRFTDSPGTSQDYVSALLAPVNPPLKGLPGFDKGLEMTVPNFYENGGDYWLYADFPVYYDPCTCEYPSAVVVQPFLVDVQQVDLDMVGGGTIFPQKIISNGNVQSNPFNAVINTLSEGQKQGDKVSKALDGFISGIESVGQLFDFSAAQTSNADGEGEKKADESIKKGFKLPKWLKSIPKIGKFTTILQYLTGGGKKTAKSTPSSYETNLSFDITGEVTSGDEFQNLYFYTPGSAWHTTAASDPNFEPVYNNILGTFALLKLPVVKYRSYGSSSGNYYQFKDDLTYAINPASGLSQTPVDIKAALVFEGCHKSAFYLQGQPPFAASDLYITENLDNGMVTLQTPLLPLGCLNDYVVDLNWLTANSSCEPEVRLKVMVAMERDPNDYFYDPDAEDVIFTANYDVVLIEDTSIEDSEIDNYQINTQILSDLTLTQSETVYAWSTIEISADINPMNNLLTYVAGSEIIIEPSVNGGSLLNAMDLVIGYPPECDEVIDPQSSAEVANFCTGGLYDPATTGLREESPPSLRNQFETDVGTLDIAVGPNPFAESVTINYTVEKDTKAKIVIMNALGQIVKDLDVTLYRGDQLQKTLDTSDLEKGFYLFSLNIGEVTESFKLTKL